MYFKIAQNQQVADIGTQCLCWNNKHHRYFYCGIDDGMLVQGFFTNKNYHDDWFKDPPESDDSYELAIISVIDQTEYDELYELLSDGEDIPVPEPEPEPPQPEPEPSPEPEPEHRMTVQEMRDKIAELTALVMNDATEFTALKDYQTGELIQNGARVYIANQVIVRGETVYPNVNCTETTIAEVYNQIQKGE